jgi:radical SAM superfamily enzyme YgiQ (UPF0313 family)
MKIYLINPPSSHGVKMVREGRCMQRKGAWTTIWPPITLATMAALLIREGVQVRMSDCIAEDMSFEQLNLALRKFNPDLVVLNTATASIYSDLSTAKLTKDICPQAKTLAFGLHVTALPDEAFALSSQLDFVIRGEPEFCLLDLAKKLKEGDDNFAEIKGLSYRTERGIHHNQECGFDGDLNTLPFPAWELINVRNYPLPFSGEPFLLITTSKGCQNACLFCPAKPFYGRLLRFRDHHIVTDEMAYVVEKFGVRQFLIWSESFTEKKEYVISLCDEILRRKLPVSWVCNSRVDRVDLGMLSLMKKAGCWMIGYGVESGNQDILDQNKKNITVAQVEEAISLAKKAELEITAHVIFGLPGETMATGLQTIRWLNKLPIDYVQVYCAVPWPSTQLYHIAKEKNWLLTNNWELYEQNVYILDTKSIKPEEVKYLRGRALLSFYLSPKRIVTILRKINSFRKARLFLYALKEFFSWL